jgi:hypothetical protein
MLGQRPKRIRGLFIVLFTLLVVAGVALTILGIGPMGWRLIVPGVGLLATSIPVVFVLCRPRIEDAAKLTGRSRAVVVRRDTRGF